LITVKRLLEENAATLKLRCIAGISGQDRGVLSGVDKNISSMKRVAGTQGHNALLSYDTQRTSAADMVGHLNLIHPGRIQVFGHEEVAYYARLDAARRTALTSELMAGKPPTLVIAEDLTAPVELLEACDREFVPLYTSPYSSAEVIDALRVWLGKRLAPTILLHGVFMDVLGLGVMITGESGLGKSELALELVSRFSRPSPNTIEGRCPPLLQNLLEVRGLGLLDIKAIFGETSVRRKMRLRLIVHLVRKQTMEAEYERLPLESLTQDVLGLPVKKVVIPVAAGRNIAVLLEAAVRNTVLQLRGIDTMKDFMERQRQAIEQQQQQQQ
jgi:HPr kinase/phosphorylase